MPPLPEVAFLYEDRESQDFQPQTQGVGRAIKTVAFRRQARQLLRNAGVESGPVRILDFACGSGLFTHCMGEVAPQASVTGSDFHSTPPADLGDLAYVPLDQLDPLKGSFDVVLAMHVLEHDDDAAGLCDRIAAMARPGGTVIFEVPNIDCFWTDLLGQAWDAWYLPFHRTHFSSRSLRALIESRGLEIVREVPICLPTMGRSLANLVGAQNSVPFLLAGIALHPVQWAGEKLSGRPSALRIVARRH
jgi:SAM-dependent methyltransferase